MEKYPSHCLHLGGCELTQPFCRDLGRNVSLRSSQHFKSNHEFSNGRRTQQRWIEVCMKMPLRVLLAVARRLMKSHRIRKRDVENFIVGCGHLMKNTAERRCVLGREIVHAFHMPAAAHK